jgi:hypothetical protein
MNAMTADSYFRDSQHCEVSTVTALQQQQSCLKKRFHLRISKYGFFKGELATDIRGC